jgi:predicted DNA-binding transcriptional regulator AlpA
MDGTISNEALADRLGVTVKTLWRWRKRGDGPPHIRFVSGGDIRYALADVDAWLARRTLKP